MRIIDDIEVTHFIEVDLDLHFAEDLEPLVHAFGKRVFVLHASRHRRAWIARLSLSRRTKTLDATLRAFCRLIETLSPVERALWNRTRRREFNVGIQAGHQPHGEVFFVQPDTLAAIAALRARLAFTIYAPESQT